MFRPNRDENEERRRLHKEKLLSLYRSPNTVRVIKIKMAGHVARMEEGRSAFKILTDIPTGRDLWKGLSVDGWTIFKK